MYGKSLSCSWTDATQMPEPRSRFCAVPVNADTIAVLGGESGENGANDEQMASTDMKTYSTANRDW